MKIRGSLMRCSVLICDNFNESLIFFKFKQITNKTKQTKILEQAAGEANAKHAQEMLLEQKKAEESKQPE